MPQSSCLQFINIFWHHNLQFIAILLFK